jgi:hypothetical protein
MPTVYGLFEQLDLAEAGVQRLQEAGCTSDMLGIAVRAPGSQNDPSGVTAAGTESVQEVLTLARSGQLVHVPGASGYLVSGPLIDGLSKAAMGGVFAALLGLGHSEDHADVFGQGLESGGVLVGVFHLNKSQATTARRILDEEGARHVALV